MNLRELTNDQMAILKLVEDGELTSEDVKDHLDMIDEERTKKIENILYVLSELEATEAAQKNELDRITSMAKQTSNKISQLKDYLTFNMEDGEKHKFDLFSVSRVKGRDVVDVIDEGSIPKEYLTHKPEAWSPDKRTILAELKKGTAIDGVELTKGKPSIRIK